MVIMWTECLAVCTAHRKYPDCVSSPFRSPVSPPCCKLSPICLEGSTLFPHGEEDLIVNTNQYLLSPLFPGRVLGAGDTVVLLWAWVLQKKKKLGVIFWLPAAYSHSPFLAYYLQVSPRQGLTNAWGMHAKWLGWGGPRNQSLLGKGKS